MNYRSEDQIVQFCGRDAGEVRVNPDAIVYGHVCGFCRNAQAPVYKAFWLKDGTKKVYFCRYQHMIEYEKDMKDKAAKKAEKKQKKTIPEARACDLRETNFRRRARHHLEIQKPGTVYTVCQFWRDFTGQDSNRLSRQERELIREFLRSQPLWLPGPYVNGMIKTEGFTKIETLEERDHADEMGQDAAG